MSGPLPPFEFVTGNRSKLDEAQRTLGFRPPHVAIDLPEIQSLSLEEVVRAKAEEAWRQLRRPLMVEDTSLELRAMGGFPGPLVKWMLEAIGVPGIARTAKALGDTRATARTLLLYRTARGSFLAEGAVPGTLVVTPRGEGGFGWDPVFQPDGSARTYAEMEEGEKDRLGHRGRAWRAWIDGVRGAWE